jgi:D-3-phosphoglycerate dehydrogenase
MTLHVLFSAPYMVPFFDRFRPLFESAGIDVTVARVQERLSEEELLPYCGKIDGALTGDDAFTARVLTAAAPRLKVISKWGTGIDSIDRDAAARLGIAVCNTVGVFSEAVADSVTGYMLAFARRQPWMDRAMKSGRWEKIPGRALHECTLGVVGVGHCGRAVLQRGHAFGMTLLGNDIVPIDGEFLRTLDVEMLPLEDLLARADFVSLNCDLNPTSYHLMNAGTLSRMMPGAILINCARGPVVDEAALVGALEAGTLAGAALDVFEVEPLPPTSRLLGMEQVLLAPHNANSSPSAWEHVHWNTLRNLFLGMGVPLPPGFPEP